MNRLNRLSNLYMKIEQPKNYNLPNFEFINFDKCKATLLQISLRGKLFIFFLS